MGPPSKCLKMKLLNPPFASCFASFKSWDLQQKLATGEVVYGVLWTQEIRGQICRIQIFGLHLHPYHPYPIIPPVGEGRMEPLVPELPTATHSICASATAPRPTGFPHPQGARLGQRLKLSDADDQLNGPVQYEPSSFGSKNGR